MPAQCQSKGFSSFEKERTLGINVCKLSSSTSRRGGGCVVIVGGDLGQPQHHHEDESKGQTGCLGVGRELSADSDLQQSRHRL
jgi:hypothetical protein